MNIKLCVLGFFLVGSMQKSIAMDATKQAEFNQERRDTAILLQDAAVLLLEGKYSAEETSCCGFGPWQRQAAVVDLAEKVAQGALVEGLSEAHSARIVKFIEEREVLAGEWCCDDRGRCPRLEKALYVNRAICMAVKKDK